jgi:hypothetical protein
MPSPQVDGMPLPMTPFGCIYKEWIRYHNGRPSIELQGFFAHLIRVYPNGPRTIKDITTTYKSLYQEVVSLLRRIKRGEIKRQNSLP